MPERFRFTSGEEHALRRPFTRPSRRVRRCAGSELLIFFGQSPAAPSAAFGVTSPASQGRIPGVAHSSVARRIEPLVSRRCLRGVARRRTTAFFHLHRHAPDPPPFMGERDHAKHGGGGCRGESSHRNVLRRSIPGRPPKPATSSRRRRASAGGTAGSADTGLVPTRSRRDARPHATASAGRTGWCGQGRSCPHRRC
jgi:hypothetical protein